MKYENSYEKAKVMSKQGLKEETAKLAKRLGVSLPKGEKIVESQEIYEPNFSLDKVIDYIFQSGMNVSETLIRRYHLSLMNRGFVILTGNSGTGKTWLTELYAEAIQAKYLMVPVAPNWTSNEDLLGFFNPLDNQYKHTPFSLFLMDAQKEYEKAVEEKRPARPYHIVLDEMNLARVEYYFAKFLSLMEVRSRQRKAYIEIPPNDKIILTPNLFFIGTINVDETTHGFADKIFDRAQLIETEIDRDDIISALGDVPYKDILLDIWDTIYELAPFAYRVINDIDKYIHDAEKFGIGWKEALDEQILQKILPKINGSDVEAGAKLEELKVILENATLLLSLSKVQKMLERYANYGVATYF